MTLADGFLRPKVSFIFFFHGADENSRPSSARPEMTTRDIGCTDGAHH